MSPVGFRAFKAELSRYLREVRSGRSVFVTDRGQIIAEVSAPVLPPSRRRTRRLQRADVIRRCAAGSSPPTGW